MSIQFYACGIQRSKNGGIAYITAAQKRDVLSDFDPVYRGLVQGLADIAVEQDGTYVGVACFRVE
jgi:hypothetical protein